MTDKFYKNNLYIRELDSIILEKLDDCILVLDRTIFYPEGGGQPCDLGKINGFELEFVYEKEGKVFHKLSVVEDLQKNHFLKLKVGDKVMCELNWERRFDNMQRHCGEHILSGIFFKELGAVNKGFHMGEEYLTIDLDMESISEETLDLVEFLSNKVIWSNEPVTITYFERISEATKLPLRKEVNLDSEISIVRVGDLEDPTDCVACCGTHPHFAGEVGLIKIYKAEKYKGMLRIYFEAGQRALLDYSVKHRILNELNRNFSANSSDLIPKIKSRMVKFEDSISELMALKEILLQHEADDLIDSISVPDEEDFNHSAGQIVIKEFEFYSIDDLAYLAKILCKNSENLYILISNKDNIVLLEKNPESSSASMDLGLLIKEYSKNKVGRGGGGKSSARISFENNNDLSDFLDEIFDLL